MDLPKEIIEKLDDCAESFKLKIPKICEFIRLLHELVPGLCIEKYAMVKILESELSYRGNRYQTLYEEPEVLEPPYKKRKISNT